MLGRKTFIHTGLNDMQLPAAQMMLTSGHKSEVQMRKHYCWHLALAFGTRNRNYNIRLVWQHAKWAVTDANLRARATMQIVKYLDGRLPRLPDTAVEVYGNLVNQVASPSRKALSV